MIQRAELKWPSLILCEGPEDCMFLRRLADMADRPYLHIQHTGADRRGPAGNSKFREKLASLPGVKGYHKVQRILIVSDNDDDPPGSFENIRTQVTAAGLVAPAAELVASAGSPSVMIMMLPLGGQRGNLESICRPAAEAAFPRIVGPTDGFLASLFPERWPDRRKEKTWLRAYLAAACPRDPFVFLGSAIRDKLGEGLLDMSHRSFDPIRAVLSALP